MGVTPDWLPVTINKTVIKTMRVNPDQLPVTIGKIQEDHE